MVEESRHNGANELEPARKPSSVRTRRGFVFWYRSRMEACDLFDGMAAFERKRSGLGAGSTSADFLGQALWVTLAAVVVSGIGLLAGYTPTTARSFPSVEYIQLSFPLGWWLRGVHKFGTDLFVILAILRLIRLAYRRAYKFGGEFTWQAAVRLLLFGVFAGVTGYLLVWNQRAFWMGGSLAEAAESGGIFEQVYPLGGLGLSEWIPKGPLGDAAMSQGVLRGVFAAHIALGFLAMLAAFYLRTYPRKEVPHWRRYSNYVAPRVQWLVIGALTILALILPPPLGSHSDTLLKPYPILADWYFLWLYRLAEIVTPAVALTIVGLIFLIAMYLPWLDGSRRKGPRPVVTALIAASLITWMMLTLEGAGWELPNLASLVLTTLVWIIALVLGAFAENWRASGRGKKGDEEVRSP